ncbi:hypothetical protein C0J52_10113 [Blattella germanica]|nr:hypothetical protein C0J52_10113 [Blattella germanica]
MCRVLRSAGLDRSCVNGVCSSGPGDRESSTADTEADMKLWVLFPILVLFSAKCNGDACGLNDLSGTCDIDLLSSNSLRLQIEANKTALCLLNGTQHEKEESRVRMFKCLLDHVDHLLPEQDQHFEEAPEHRCVLCQVVQLYTCEKTLAHAQCGERFIAQLSNIQREMRTLGVPSETINSWVQRFLDVKNWDFYRFRGTSVHNRNHSSNVIRPAYVYGRDDTHYMDRLKEKVRAFFIRVGGIPGLVAVKLLYLSCLIFNCLLIKILVCQKEMRAHVVLINLVVGDVLNLIFDNFVAVFFITHWYPSQATINILVYFNYAIVALQIYTVILYSMQRRFSGNRHSFVGRHMSLVISGALWVIGGLVPAPICLLTLSAKNGILYSFVTYVLIPLVCIIFLSKEKPVVSGDTISRCQTCSSTEKMCHQGHLERQLQTERWLQSNPAETSFDSEINSGETDTERHDSMEESALNLRRSSKPCMVEAGCSRSQGARFQRALVIVYVLTYVPAICLYLALYFAIRREEFISYRRLCVYIYSMLNPLAMYAADKTLRRWLRNTVCCCCTRMRSKKNEKMPLG